MVIFETTQQTGEISVEDGGMAKIATFSDDAPRGVFVRVQSWDDAGSHPEFDAMIGKRVRIVVEVLDA